MPVNWKRAANSPQQNYSAQQGQQDLEDAGKLEACGKQEEQGQSCEQDPESDALTPVGGPGHHAVHGHISSPVIVIDSLIGDLHMRSSAPFGI